MGLSLTKATTTSTVSFRDTYYPEVIKANRRSQPGVESSKLKMKHSLLAPGVGVGSHWCHKVPVL